jgi:hypothetical protein
MAGKDAVGDANGTEIGRQGETPDRNDGCSDRLGLIENFVIEVARRPNQITGVRRKPSSISMQRLSSRPESISLAFGDSSYLFGLTTVAGGPEVPSSRRYGSCRPR